MKLVEFNEEITKYKITNLETLEEEEMDISSLLAVLFKEKTLYIEDIEKYYVFLKNYLFKEGYEIDHELKQETFFFTSMDSKVYFLFINHKKKKYCIQDITKLCPDIELEKVNENKYKAYKTILDYYEKEEFTGKTVSSGVYNCLLNRFHFGVHVYGKRFNNIELGEDLTRKFESSISGGFNDYNKEYVERTIIKNTITIDKTSQYPYIARKYALPWGKPVEMDYDSFLKEKNRYGFIFFGAEDLRIKENKVPFISVEISEKGRIKTEYPTHIKSLCKIMTEDEFSLMKENYSIGHLEIYKVYAFKVRGGLFDEWFDYWFERKKNARQNGDYVDEYFSKKAINLPLGRIGRRSRYNQFYINSKGEFKVYENYDKFTFPVLFLFITSLARVELVRDIQRIGYDKFVYAATDSITFREFKDWKYKVPFDEKEIGYYKIEHINKKFCLARRGQYAYTDEKGENHSVLAGIKKNASYSPEDVQKGFVVEQLMWNCSNEIPVMEKKYVRV